MNLTVLSLVSIAICIAFVVWSQIFARNMLVRLYWFMNQPFRTGDYVSIGGSRGQVIHIGWQAVRLRNSAGDYVLISNALVWNQPVIQTVAETGSQGVELHLPVPDVCEKMRARLAAEEALVLSPYLALDRAYDVSLELAPSGETLLRIRAGVFDASQRDLFESSVIETYQDLLQVH